jgi:hypothetical protein
VRRATLLWTPSPFLRSHQALLVTQSRGERTIEAVALRGSLVRLRRVFYSSTALCRLGSCRRRSRHYLKDARYMKSESDAAKFRPVDGLGGVQARLPQAVQPHHVVVKSAFAVPVLVVAAVPFSSPLCVLYFSLQIIH